MEILWVPLQNDGSFHLPQFLSSPVRSAFLESVVWHLSNIFLASEIGSQKCSQRFDPILYCVLVALFYPWNNFRKDTLFGTRFNLSLVFLSVPQGYFQGCFVVWKRRIKLPPVNKLFPKAAHFQESVVLLEDWGWHVFSRRLYLEGSTWVGTTTLMTFLRV